MNIDRAGLIARHAVFGVLALFLGFGLVAPAVLPQSPDIGAPPTSSAPTAGSGVAQSLLDRCTLAQYGVDRSLPASAPAVPKLVLPAADDGGRAADSMRFGRASAIDAATTGCRAEIDAGLVAADGSRLPHGAPLRVEFEAHHAAAMMQVRYTYPALGVKPVPEAGLPIDAQAWVGDSVLAATAHVPVATADRGTVTAYRQALKEAVAEEHDLARSADRLTPAGLHARIEDDPVLRRLDRATAAMRDRGYRIAYAGLPHASQPPAEL